MVAALLVGGSILACSETSLSEPKETPTAGNAPTAQASGGDGAFCVVDLPESWRSEFARGEIGLPDTDRIVPSAVAPDGTRIFGALYSDAWSGVVAVDRQGSVTRVRPFDDPRQDQVLAAFDGRWLVWAEIHSPANWDDWDIRAWDSVEDEVFDIRAAPRVNGATVPGPFVIPVIHQGKAGWVQASESGKGELLLYDLAGRQDRVLSAGTAVPPVLFWGSRLVWVEKDAPGGAGHLAMADAETGEPLAVPEPLTSLDYIATLAASDDLVAWSPDYEALSVWRVGQSKAEEIFAGGGVDWILVSGDLVVWSSDTTQMAADLRSDSVAPITTKYRGYKSVIEGWLLVADPIGPLKSEDAVRTPGVHPTVVEIHVVDAAALPPLPECAALTARMTEECSLFPKPASSEHGGARQGSCSCWS